jgi:hypothetical protein
MFRRNLSIAGFAAAIVIAGPAFAQAHGGHGGGPPAGAGGPPGGMNPGGMNMGRPMTAPDMTTRTMPSTNSQALEHSQGPANASPTGIAHANENSVLARGAVSGTTLPGLTNGLSVQNSTGTTVGTVSQVITGSDGSIRQVIVTGTDGKTYRLAPTTLTINGNIVTTTSTTIGG